MKTEEANESIPRQGDEYEDIINTMVDTFDDDMWDIVEKALLNKDRTAVLETQDECRCSDYFGRIYKELSPENITTKKEADYGCFICRITVPETWCNVYRTRREEILEKRRKIGAEYDFVRSAANLYGAVGVDDLEEIVNHWGEHVLGDKAFCPVLNAERAKLARLVAEHMVELAQLREYSPFAHVYVNSGLVISYAKYPEEDVIFDDEPIKPVVQTRDSRKGKKRWYPDSFEGFLCWRDGNYHESPEEYKRLEAFIKDVWNVDPDDEDDVETLDETIASVYQNLSSGGVWQDARDAIELNYNLSELTKKEVAELTCFIAEAANATRLDANWGHTPMEMGVKSAQNGTANTTFDYTDFLQNPDGSIVRSEVKVGRNDPCPCGSGKKYKKCCGAADAAAECRTVSATSSPHVPEGVTEEKDDDPSLWVDVPRWRMTYEPKKNGTPEEDAAAILDRLVCPYVERHCSITDGEKDGNFEIALLQTRCRGNERLGDCPSVELGLYSQLTEMMRCKLEEFFRYFSDSVFKCEVRFDSGFGGPILILEDENGLAEMFMVALPDRFDAK